MISTGKAPARDNNSDELNKDGGGRRATVAATAWCVAGIRWPEAAEMGIKRKWEWCGYDRWKFLFSKIVTWVYF